MRQHAGIDPATIHALHARMHMPVPRTVQSRLFHGWPFMLFIGNPPDALHRSLITCIPGSSGKCVSSLQALLNRNQPYPAIAVDGYFGPQTQQAVIEFQSTYHLAVDGDVASQTAA